MHSYWLNAELEHLVACCDFNYILIMFVNWEWCHVMFVNWEWCHVMFVSWEWCLVMFVSWEWCLVMFVSWEWCLVMFVSWEWCLVMFVSCMEMLSHPPSRPSINGDDTSLTTIITAITVWLRERSHTGNDQTNDDVYAFFCTCMS